MSDLIPAEAVQAAAKVLTNLPALLREVRNARGLSLRAVAEHAECAFNTLSRVERGMDCSLHSAAAILQWIAGSQEAATPDLNPVGEEEIRADERRKVAEEFTAYEDLLGSIWLYIGWRFVTGQLTTEQKNLFADAVDACWRRSDLAEGEDFMAVDRWWRDDAPIRQIGEARDSR